MDKLAEKAIDMVGNESTQNKIADLFSLLAPYAAIKKKAVDLYVKEIEESDLSPEAKVVALLNIKKTFKHLKNQKSIADIAKTNANPGTDFSEKSGVDIEWFERYMESAGFVSSEEMQLVWGKILANEFNNPGSVPRNMTRVLSEFNHSYARCFELICGMKALFILIDNDGNVEYNEWKIAIPYATNFEYMSGVGLSFEMLNELETLGVIKFDPVAGYASVGITGKRVLIYINGKVIETGAPSDGKYPIGNVLLTSAGQELEKITEGITPDGYGEALERYLRSTVVGVEDEQLYDVTVTEDNIVVIRKDS